MSISTFLVFLAAYIAVRTGEKLFAIWYTVKTDLDLRAAQEAANQRQQEAVKTLNDALKGIRSVAEPVDWKN